jgi:hypothetical protein
MRPKKQASITRLAGQSLLILNKALKSLAGLAKPRRTGVQPFERDYIYYILVITIWTTNTPLFSRAQ